MEEDSFGLSEEFLAEIEQLDATETRSSRQTAHRHRSRHARSAGNSQRRMDHTRLTSKNSKSMATVATSGSTCSQPDRQKMNEYLERKREIFKIQMALSSKISEIKKLQECSINREIAIHKSEEMLEEDILQFEKYVSSLQEKLAQVSTRLQEERSATSKISDEIALNVQNISLCERQTISLQKEVEKVRSHTYLVENASSAIARNQDIQKMDTGVDIHLKMKQIVEYLMRLERSAIYGCCIEGLVTDVSSVSFEQSKNFTVLSRQEGSDTGPAQFEMSCKIACGVSLPSSKAACEKTRFDSLSAEMLYDSVSSALSQLQPEMNHHSASRPCPLQQISQLQSMLDTALKSCSGG